MDDAGFVWFLSGGGFEGGGGGGGEDIRLTKSTDVDEDEDEDGGMALLWKKPGLDPLIAQ